MTSETSAPSKNKTVKNPAVWCAVFLIRGYQILLSPIFGRACRFYPTCSNYALVVFKEWGFIKGFWLTLKRLLRCGPWHPGGYDPPPTRVYDPGPVSKDGASGPGSVVGKGQDE